jgi:Family of unknown function (DUF6221)
MDELIAFVKARLDDWEAGNQDRNDNGQCDWLDGWHFDPDQMRRIIAALRAIVAAYERAPDWPGGEDVRYLAAIWSDDPAYRAEWAP